MAPRAKPRKPVNHLLRLLGASAKDALELIFSAGGFAAGPNRPYCIGGHTHAELD